MESRIGLLLHGHSSRSRRNTVNSKQKSRIEQPTIDIFATGVYVEHFFVQLVIGFCKL